MSGNHGIGAGGVIVGGGTGLAVTGSPIAVWFVVGVGLVLGGMLLLRAARRRRRAEV